MKWILQTFGLEERDRIITIRTSFVLGDTRLEIENILNYNGEGDRLPPHFLEIEGQTPASIIDAAKQLGYGVADFSPFTKRDVVKDYRKRT